MFSECFACCFFSFRFVYCFCCYVRIYLVVVRTLRNTIGVRVYSFLHSFKLKMFVFCFHLFVVVIQSCYMPHIDTLHNTDRWILLKRKSEWTRTYVCIWCVCLRMFRIAHLGRTVKNVLTNLIFLCPTSLYGTVFYVFSLDEKVYILIAATKFVTPRSSGRRPLICLGHIPYR